MKNIFKIAAFTILFVVSSIATSAQSSSSDYYWQQHVDYTMEIDMDVNTYRYDGKQTLIYTNNSPDTLKRVFYHLYFNAFQPGSEMDIRSRSIFDPDKRVVDRISKLLPNEMGYINVRSLKQDEVVLKHEVVGTVLEVDLHQPIQPGEQVTFEMEFDAQVPVQIRRSGRNNKEGVALSMAQWYPKMAEYDFEGWHADPYIAREFYGVWGNFDVKLTIDKTYTVAGTGYLQNPNEIGHGYETGPIETTDNDKLTWHFIAPNVHDFTWAADPDYIHDIRQVSNGPTMHFFYKNSLDDEKKRDWEKIQPISEKLLLYFNEHVGAYPYDQYSVIQGGDGGMEYAMCTLITADRSFGSLVGTTSHEIAHTWFQFLLANNEAKHAWMDEGFADYIGDLAINEVMDKNLANPFEKSYESYINLARSGLEQPQTTHADRYQINGAYSAYSKGCVFLSQLSYIIGQDNLERTLKTYFKEWSFKHPTPNDFIRVAEKISGLELDWYLTDWTRTTNTIDYGIYLVEDNEEETRVILSRSGLMPMPIDLEVTYVNGQKELYYIPLRMMRGEKPSEEPRHVLTDWAWAYPYYELFIKSPKSEIASIVIDPSNLMADINREDNKK
jgi:hypothetical protein